MGDKFPYGTNVYWLSHFAINEKYRHQGIGTLLLQFLENEIRKFGGKQLWVYTSQARGFYEKKGFVFIKKALIDEEWEEVLKKDL